MTSVTFSRLESFDFLCKCLSLGDAHDPELSSQIDRGGVDWPAVILLAGRHLVTPSLARALKEKGLFSRIDQSYRDYLDAIQFLNRERNQTHRQQLMVIARALNEIGVYPLLLKGAIALLPGQYSGAEDRVIGDLDLQIPSERLEDATEALCGLGYERRTGAEVALQPPSERQSGHHAPPLLHRSLPVKVELHRRILHGQEDDFLLSGSLVRARVELENGAIVEVPEPNARALHNFLHAQITDRLALKRVVNLRQTNEFARLVTFYADIHPDAMRKALRPLHHQRLAEYWAQAEYYFCAHYPAELPRSPNELWERRFHRLLLSNSMLRRSFDSGVYAIGLPPRLRRLFRLTWEYPSYFPIKLKLIVRELFGRRDG